MECWLIIPIYVKSIIIQLYLNQGKCIDYDVKHKFKGAMAFFLAKIYRWQPYC